MFGVITEFILVFLVFCASLFVGPAWSYAVLPFYVGLLSLKWTPVGRRLKVSRLFLACTAFGLAIALVVGRISFDFLSALSINYVDSQVFRFFLGSGILRLFWSICFGLFIALDLLALFLIPLAYFTAQGRYSDYEVYRRHRGQATITALYGMLGLNQGRINVRNGVAQIDKGPNDSLVLFGGPGELMVQEGHVVILEHNGRISKIVGSGLTFLRPFERVSMVVPLHTRADRVTVEQVMTREGVTIESLDIWVFHAPALGNQDERVADGEYEYNCDVLRFKIWSPGGNDWRDTVKGVTDRVARKIVPKYSLREIIGFDDADGQLSAHLSMPEMKRDALALELKFAVSEIMVRLGVEIRSLDLGAIRVSPEIRAQFEEGPLAMLASEAARIEIELTGYRAAVRLRPLDSMMEIVRERLGADASPNDLTRAWSQFAPILFADSTQDATAAQLRHGESRTGQDESLEPQFADGKDDMLVVRIEGYEEGQPLRLNQEYTVNIGIMGNPYDWFGLGTRSTADELWTFDVVVSAEDMTISPSPHQQLRSFPGRDTGFIEYRVRPQQLGPKVIRVEIYRERDWLQSAELKVDVVNVQLIEVLIRNSFTGAARDMIVTSAHTAELVVEQLTSAMEVPLLATGGAPVILQLLFRGMLVPHNATMAEIGVRDGSELWLVAAPAPEQALTTEPS